MMYEVNSNVPLFKLNSVMSIKLFLLKINFVLCLIKHHAVKSYGAVEVVTHAFLTLVVDASEWSAFCPKRLTFLHKHAVSSGKAPNVEIKT